MHIATHSGLDKYGTGYLQLWSGTTWESISAPTLLKWPWDSVGLANLASCSSGRSAQGPHDLHSLTGALLTAGAHSVLGSLWEIPDRDGAAFMLEFYESFLTGGLSPSAALHAVQRRWLDAEKPGPMWWAGLVVIEG